MSRRKQKRPLHFFRPIRNTSWLLQHEEQLALKSLTSTLAKNSSCSPSSSATQTCRSVGKLTTPCLPTTRHFAPHVACHLTESHRAPIPNIPQSCFSSHSTTQCMFTIASAVPSTHNHIHALMASPKLGVSVTTTSSSSSSSAVSLCVPPHPGSPSPVPEGPPSPVTPSPSPSTAPPACAPVSIAVILEELRVLQQRQIHQMQMTEEICRQVLRLGGASCEMDSTPLMLPPLPQLCLKSNPMLSRPSPSPPPSSMAPLLACFSSLLPSQTTSKSTKHTHPLLNVLRPHKTQCDSGVIASASSSMSTPAVSNIPLALSLGLPAQNSFEKSSNITGASTQGSITNQSLAASSAPSAPSQDTKLSAQGGATSLLAGRMQHACRFCRKLFSSDSSLQIHLRSHTGERPYQCPICFSRFTTRGNLKVHFLRHREQNPELSFTLFPCSLFASVTGASAQTQTLSKMSTAQKHQKQQAEDDLCAEGLEGATASPCTTASSLPLPSSIDLALLTTAHSLLQLNHASAAVTSTSSASLITSSSSSSLASTLLSAPASSTFSVAGLYKGVKQQHFDENTPPIPTLLPRSAYSQLANLPKIFFPASSTHHHPGHGFLRPTTSTGSFMSATEQHISFPFPASSTVTSITTPTSDTSKLQRLVEKLEKEPKGQAQWVSSIGETSTSVTGALSYSSSSLMSTNTFSTNVVTSLPSSTVQIPSALFSKESPYLGLMNSAGALAPNQCSVCLRVLSCPRALRLHQATHLGERPFPCKLCGRSFSTKGSLRAHLATHRARPPNSRAQNSCPLCQRKFTNALVLQHHIRMHLGGQLPPENLPDTATECDSLPRSQSTEPSASETSPSTTDVQLLHTDKETVSDSRCSFSSHSDLLTVSTAPTVCPITSSLPGSLSTAPVPPFDLSLDLSINPTPHSPLTARADPLDLFGSVPSPVESAAFLVPSASLSISAASDPPATDELSFEHFERDRNNSSSSVKANTHIDEVDFRSENRSLLPIPCSGSKTNLEDLLGVPGHKASRASLSYPASTSPSHLPLSTESLSSHTVSIMDPDLVQTSKSISQDFSKKENMEGRMHKTPKTPDLSVNVNVVSDALDKTSEVAAETEEPETMIPKTIKEGHCSSTKKDNIDIKEMTASDKERTEPTVCMSLTPSLPPPMPEKKTYHCSECGKEYASRSGLKGHMKHHGGVVKAHRALARTKGPERVSQHERPQTHHSTHLPSGHQ